jgi:hypothetical protein
MNVILGLQQCSVKVSSWPDVDVLLFVLIIKATYEARVCIRRIFGVEI